MSSSKGSRTYTTASSAVVAPAKRQKTITSTVEEAGRQAMIESLKRELDKLYRNFDLLIQGSAAIHGFANIMKDLIRNDCLQIAGADALEYTPEPATLQEIVQMFGPSSVKSLRDEAMKEIDNRVVCNFVSMLQEDYAVLWKLKLVMQFTKLFKKQHERNCYSLPTVDVRIEEQRAMLTELFIVAGKTITRHKGFETQMVRESVSTNSLSATQQEAIQNFERMYSQNPRCNHGFLAAVIDLYQQKLWALFLAIPLPSG
ncbi:uncharacterized protein K444DRAFT_706963 [Hyaloscypha bicolor E]|uniref:Uncharacterized protein n=1 Tax=Hyaloscypha bicolor E TaxID=1095630 RepID=A0A2J6SK05_9HELO|nr:uncharacterized protein K444DRAFT_706963 [Hyaloscypha bicolor E]PMD51085.1 hypothetical protein K444DRAFT_706963 [Hyaloscypha bicolor E]